MEIVQQTLIFLYWTRNTGEVLQTHVILPVLKARIGEIVQQKNDIIGNRAGAKACTSEVTLVFESLSRSPKSVIA